MAHRTLGRLAIVTQNGETDTIALSNDMTKKEYSIYQDLSNLITSNDFIFTTTKKERKDKISKLLDKIK